MWKYLSRVPVPGSCQAGACYAIPIYHRNITMVTERGQIGGGGCWEAEGLAEKPLGKKTDFSKVENKRCERF